MYPYPSPESATGPGSDGPGSGDGEDGRRRADAGEGRLHRWLTATAGMALFLLAVRVMGASTEALSPALRDAVPSLLVGSLAVVGAGWLATYLLLNGSVVAALALTLFTSGLLGAGDTVLMVSGSRLGSAAFVVLVGVLDHWRHRRRRALRESLDLGLLTFVVTHFVYIPATILAWAGTRWAGDDLADVVGAVIVPLPAGGVVQPLVEQVAGRVGGLPVFAVSIGLLFVAIQLVDRAARSMDLQRLRERYLYRLEDRWISFGVGLLLTLLTASVGFSVGIAVPLYNRGHLTRRQAVPYVMGANIGTLADTVVVGTVLQTPMGTVTVVVLALAVAAVTLPLLVLYRPFFRGVEATLDAVTRTRTAFVLFALSLAAAPALLLVVARL